MTLEHRQLASLDASAEQPKLVALSSRPFTQSFYCEVSMYDSWAFWGGGDLKNRRRCTLGTPSSLLGHLMPKSREVLMEGLLTPHWGSESKSPPWALTAPRRARALKTATVTFMMSALNEIRVVAVGLWPKDWVL